jgi:hypothetical protein
VHRPRGVASAFAAPSFVHSPNHPCAVPIVGSGVGTLRAVVLNPKQLPTLRALMRRRPSAWCSLAGDCCRVAEFFLRIGFFVKRLSNGSHPRSPPPFALDGGVRKRPPGPATGTFQPEGVWGVGSRQLEGGWKWYEGGWHGGWHGGWKPHSPVGRRLEGAVTSRCRCFDGGPKVSTMIRFAVSSRSIALAKAVAVQPLAPGIVANSFGA